MSRENDLGQNILFLHLKVNCLFIKLTGVRGYMFYLCCEGGWCGGLCAFLLLLLLLSWVLTQDGEQHGQDGLGQLELQDGLQRRHIHM